MCFSPEGWPERDEDTGSISTDNGDNTDENAHESEIHMLPGTAHYSCTTVNAKASGTSTLF